MSLESNVVELEADLERLDADGKALLQHFGEDSATMNIEEFFNLWVQFSASLQKARKEIEDAVKRTSQPLLTGFNPKRKQTGPSVPMGLPMMEKGDLENAIRQLKQGTVTRKGRRPGTASGEDTLETTSDAGALATEAIIRLQQQRMTLNK